MLNEYQANFNSRNKYISGEGALEGRKPFVGVCRGALGELFQGPSVDESDEIVVVSSLIPKYSWAYFTPCDTGFSSLQDQKLSAPERANSFHALELFCRDHEITWPSGYWSFNSDLEVARGMASSTADIVAILRCAANCIQHPLAVDEVIRILAKIERSDAVFLNQLSLFCSSNHKIIHQFDKVPSLYALYMHEAATVDTKGTKSLLVDFYKSNYFHYRDLFQNAELALSSADVKAMCDVSTKSAELSNEVIPKPHFQSIFCAQSNFSADGVIVAHTGSVVGLLYCQPPCVDVFERVAKFYRELGGYCQFAEIRA
ncbi:hypothetical protein [uncultured Microbulbifer sp.]|uniref:GHMP family kinase ATP-binding protein n=1 Tax=uncultured Microbulbifer sp. TaxID=348147 RepID=UPI002602F3AD|nr:hypothetical protein [uncultured Microbulbifer sp.]